MLTVPQAGVLELLQELECLRIRHIEQYAAARYGSSTAHVSRMLRQLAMLGRVKVEGELVMLPRRKPDFAVLRAFDVALALTGGQVEFAAKGGRGFTLVFAAQGRTFGVAMVGEGMEYIVPMRLQASSRSGLTVIFLLHDADQRRYIQAAEGCYFAVQKDGGGYRFLK